MKHFNIKIHPAAETLLALIPNEDNKPNVATIIVLYAISAASLIIAMVLLILFFAIANVSGAGLIWPMVILLICLGGLGGLLGSEAAKYLE